MWFRGSGCECPLWNSSLERGWKNTPDGELFKTTPNLHISAASQDKSKTTGPWKCANIFTKTVEMSIKLGSPTVLGGFTNTMTSALSRACKPSCSESLRSQGELLLWFWPQCLNITRYSSVFAHRIWLRLKLVVRLVYIFSLFALGSRKAFDESLLVLQRRDDGVSAGEKHCGRANHTCGARRLFLDSPSEDVSAFFFFFFLVSSELLKLVRFQTRLHKY